MGTGSGGSSTIPNQNQFQRGRSCPKQSKIGSKLGDFFTSFNPKTFPKVGFCPIKLKSSSRGAGLAPFNQKKTIPEGWILPRSTQNQFQRGEFYLIQPKTGSKGLDFPPLDPKPIPQGWILPNSTQNQFQRGGFCPTEPTASSRGLDLAPLN